MLASLDHGDLAKSRKALLVSSVTTIIVSNAAIKDGPIKISDFEVVVNQATVVFWLKVSVVYFLYIFCIRLMEYFDRRQLEQSEAHVEFLKSGANSFTHRAEAHAEYGKETYEEILRSDHMKAFFSKRQFVYFLMAEATPAFLVASAALFGIAKNILPSS